MCETGTLIWESGNIIVINRSKPVQSLNKHSAQKKRKEKKLGCNREQYQYNLFSRAGTESLFLSK